MAKIVTSASQPRAQSCRVWVARDLGYVANPLPQTGPGPTNRRPEATYLAPTLEQPARDCGLGTEFPNPDRSTANGGN